jgi:hypothetical protein
MMGELWEAGEICGSDPTLLNLSFALAGWERQCFDFNISVSSFMN